MVERVRRRHRLFYADYGLQKQYADSDWLYARRCLSSPKMPRWNVVRRDLGPELADAVAYTSFADQEIVFNERHLSLNLYPSLFHFQTACHELAHEVMFGSQHGAAWANLTRLLGDRTARAYRTYQSGTNIPRLRE